LPHAKSRSMIRPCGSVDILWRFALSGHLSQQSFCSQHTGGSTHIPGWPPPLAAPQRLQGQDTPKAAHPVTHSWCSSALQSASIQVVDWKLSVNTNHKQQQPAPNRPFMLPHRPFMLSHRHVASPHRHVVSPHRHHKLLHSSILLGVCWNRTADKPDGQPCDRRICHKPVPASSHILTPQNLRRTEWRGVRQIIVCREAAAGDVALWKVIVCLSCQRTLLIT